MTRSSPSPFSPPRKARTSRSPIATARWFARAPPRRPSAWNRATATSRRPATTLATMAL